MDTCGYHHFGDHHFNTHPVFDDIFTRFPILGIEVSLSRWFVLSQGETQEKSGIDREEFYIFDGGGPLRKSKKGD